MSIDRDVSPPQGVLNFPRPFDVVLGGNPLQATVRLTQINVETTQGKLLVPAIAIDSLVVNSNSINCEEFWTVTHAKTGFALTPVNSFNTVFGALHAAIALEKLDWSWIPDSVPIKDMKGVVLKPPRGLIKQINQIVNNARNWEKAAMESLEGVQR
jgi:hypothetical protein